MKKAGSIISLLFVIAILIPFHSCSKSNDEPVPEPAPLPYMEIEKVVYEISAEAQTFEVPVKTNISLRVQLLEGSIGWISASKTGEEGDVVTYSVMVKENNGTDAREGVVMFRPVEGTYIPQDAQMGSNTIIIQQDGAKP
ncbi:MAG: BACON domain-containing protein [Bacteroidaceae bacterium]|nr:BACON domain-containing protein [Bacteroidaceae bacterium]